MLTVLCLFLSVCPLRMCSLGGCESELCKLMDAMVVRDTTFVALVLAVGALPDVVSSVTASNRGSGRLKVLLLVYCTGDGGARHCHNMRGSLFILCYFSFYSSFSYVRRRLAQSLLFTADAHESVAVCAAPYAGRERPHDTVRGDHCRLLGQQGAERRDVPALDGGCGTRVIGKRETTGFVALWSRCVTRYIMILFYINDLSPD